MLFNLWFGQMRPAGTRNPSVRYIKKMDSIKQQHLGLPRQVVDAANVGAGYKYLPIKPRGMITVSPNVKKSQLKYKPEGVTYKVDKRGNIDVDIPAHIKIFVELGFPIYNGLFLENIKCPTERFFYCPRESFLLWADNPEYDRRVLEGLSKTKEGFNG